MRRKYLITFAITIVFFAAGFGCSNGGDVSPLSPEQDVSGTSQLSNVHYTWGLWQFIADPVNETLDVIQLRAGNMHLNALPFLEPPPLLNLSLESLEFNGDEIYACIGLRHPFLGLTEFTGFDVCGILITKGSVSGFDDPDITMAGEEDTYLMNPDGFTRWWNPAEFPVNNGTIFSYTDGLLGAPDSFADYNSTVNACKFFCDDLDDPDDDINSLDPSNRCTFSAGQKNIRMYRIKLGTDGLIFNYAIDACWQFPQGDPPWSAPEDFGPEANRPEAWNISVNASENTLWNDGSSSGGDATLLIDVWDHFDADLNTVKVESPGNFTPVISVTAIGGGEGYSTYQVEITDATPDEGQISLLISIISEIEDFGGYLPGTNTTSYFRFDIDVAEEQQTNLKNIPLRTGVEALDLGIQHNNGDCWILYNDDQVWVHTADDDYQTGTYVYTVTCASPSHDFHPKFIDVNSIGIMALGHNTPTLTVCWTWRYRPDGTKMNEKGLIGACTQRWLPDVGAFSNNGTYADHVVYFCGGYWQSSSFRNWWYNYGPPNYNSHDYPYGSWCSNYTGTGISGVDRINVTAIDTDKNGANLWILEGASENHCTMWQLTPPGYFPNLDYAGSYFPSSSDSIYWHDPVDLTRDDQNRQLLLDEDSAQGIISVWTGSSTGGSYIGQVGDPSTISEQPRRIDGSDFDGKVYIIHGDTYGPSDGYLLSIFEADELP